MCVYFLLWFQVWKKTKLLQNTKQRGVSTESQPSHLFGENGTSVLSRILFAFLVLWFGNLVEVWSSFLFILISLKRTTTTDSYLFIGSTATFAGCFKELRRTWELLPFISVTVMVPSCWSAQSTSSSIQFMAIPETFFSTRHTVCKTKFQYYKYI